MTSRKVVPVDDGGGTSKEIPARRRLFCWRKQPRLVLPLDVATAQLHRAARAGVLVDFEAALDDVVALRGPERGAAARRAAIAGATRDGWTLLHGVCIGPYGRCYVRGGGRGAGGWLGVMRLILRHVGADKRYVNARMHAGAPKARRVGAGSTALHALVGKVYNWSPDNPSEKQMLAAAAALLAHGANTGAREMWDPHDRGRTPLDVATSGDDPNPHLCALLRLADRVGGREAVRRVLEHDLERAVLINAPGWMVVRDLPALKALTPADARPSLRSMSQQLGNAASSRALFDLLAPDAAALDPVEERDGDGSA